MPLQATSGAASYDAFGGGVAAVPNYIEDVFSTYLYTGNGSTQTITNGIDLAGEGGLVWIKNRTHAGTWHDLQDTERGPRYSIFSNSTSAAVDQTSYGVQSFNSDGFSVGTGADFNESTYPIVSWTFRKQPKFFDVVTYTGNGTGTSIGGGVLQRDIAHSLTSTPGCVIIKNLDTSNWVVYHRSSAFGTENLRLNTTGAGFNASGYAPIYAVSDTTFSVIVGATGLSSNDNCNINGASYVAYVFAHNAGGFGLTGTDNVISCGSFTLTGSPVTVNLGYEPQWLLVKRTEAAGSWVLLDTMREMSVTNNRYLLANTSDAEGSWGTSYFTPTATGFTTSLATVGAQYIYIAIRRGPMKVPTSGTSVFMPAVVSEATSAPYLNTYTTNFPVDSVIEKFRGGSQTGMFNRLLGNQYLIASSTSAGLTGASTWDAMSTVTVDAMQGSTGSSVAECFRRAPSFFDEVCYTGTGSATTVTHNLGVAPELMIVKQRSSTTGWVVYSSALAASDYLVLNNTSASQTASTIWNSTAPTASVFSVGTSTTTNTSAGTYVAYLFATCAGVSKVGSYTGTATTLQVDCGFTGGARFVLIKKTSGTGSWYVWDVARGISSGNDPYLLLNSTAAEVTNTDYIDAYSAGFEISSTAPAEINASGGSFIFLAIS